MARQFSILNPTRGQFMRSRMDHRTSPWSRQLPWMHQVISTCITTSYSRTRFASLISSLKTRLQLRIQRSVASRIWACAVTHFRNLVRRPPMSCHNEPHNEVTEPGRTRQIAEIEVVLSPDAPSGVETWDFDQDQQHDKLPRAWPAELVEILRNNNLVSWKPSFPLRYPWSEYCSKEEALESYIKADRDRFLRFNFPQGSNVRSIAKKLKALDEIDQAVTVPGLVPPSHQPGGFFT